MKKHVFVNLVISILLCFVSVGLFVMGNIDEGYYEPSDPVYYVSNKTEIANAIKKERETLIKEVNQMIYDGEYLEALKAIKASDFSDDIQLKNLSQYLTRKVAEQNLSPYSGTIDILLFEPIISFPEVLKKNTSQSSVMDENLITLSEFEKILIAIYENNFILVDPVQALNGRLYVPYGKKPIILALSSASYNVKNGTVDKLILDNNGELVTYTPKRSINDRIHHSNDFITLLETFASNRPDFSLNSARGLICVDGSSGIMGYKTQKTNANSKYQIKKCYEVASNLRDNGWKFACSGYKYGVGDNDINFASGLSHWKEVVEPIIGKTSIYIGNFDDFNEYKSSLLSSYGYTTLLNTSPNSSDIAIVCNKVSGKTLRQNHDDLLRFFDSEKVYDHINRATTYCSD